MVAPQWEQFQSPNQSFPEEDQSKEDKIVSLQEEEQPEPEQVKWGDLQSPETYQGPPDPTKEEGTLGYFVRNITANASRLGEQVLGRYGNIEKMGKDILTNLPSSGGILGWALSELVGPEKWERMVKGPPSQEQMLPTSQQLKEVSIKGTKEYTKPKTTGEEKFQTFVEDVGSTLSRSRAATARNVAVNNLGIPAVSNAVENIVEGLGFGKDKATVAKLGTWTALSLLGNVNAPQYASQLMNQGRNGVPNNLQIDTPRFQRRLQAVANDPHLLHADPRTALARESLASIHRDLANGQTSVRSLMTSYDGINAAKRNRGLFDFNRNDRDFARAAIDQVRNAVRDEIMASAVAHPEALNNWRSGIQAWAVIHQSRGMTNWIDALARGPYAKALSGPAAGLFGIGAYGGFKAPIIAGPISLAVPAAYKVGQTAYRVWQDPNLSRYYWNAVGAAQRENLPAFLNNYNKLNEGVKKLDSAEIKAKRKKD